MSMADETETAQATKEEMEAVREAVKESPARAPQAKAASFPNLEQKVVNPPSSPGNISLLLDVPLKVSVQLGNTKMLIKDLLRLGPGSVLELPKVAGDPMDICIGEKLIARGDIVVVNEMFGVRITDIISPTERIETLKQ